MKTQKTYIKVSPEVLKSDIVQETYSGNTFADIITGGVAT